MCKFVKPIIPENATEDERRSIMFDSLCSLDLNDKVEKYNEMSYLSWANAWQEFKSAYPSATYEIKKNPTTGLPCFSDPSIGIFVFTSVTVDGLTHEMWLPVMDQKNKAMKEEPYTYQAWDSYKKQYVEKNVAAASAFDVNKTIMRCLVKNLAMFGLGLYIYSGDDLPEKASEENKVPQEPKAKAQKPFDRFAGVKDAINKAQDVNTLLTLFLDHETEINANPNIKAMFTQRRQQLQLLNKN